MNQIMREVEIQQRIENHQHIVKQHDVKTHKQNMFLIMEFCQDGDLRSYLRSKPK